MGKVLKYIGWSFLGVLILVMGTIGVLFAMGKFEENKVFLDTIEFDQDSIVQNLDKNNTTISKIGDKLVVNDNFDMTVKFTPETSTVKNLKLSVTKGNNAVKVPSVVVAGEPFTIEIEKVKKVNVGSTTYTIVDNNLYNSNDELVEGKEIEIFEEIHVIKIDGVAYKYYEHNVGGEILIKAYDNEGGTTWNEFSFFIDSDINGLNYDFSNVPGKLEDGKLVFTESDLKFNLYTNPVLSINPSTGEVYKDAFTFKTVLTSSDNVGVINIKRTEKIGYNGENNKYIRYTFNTVKAGTATITSKVLPTYQMYLDYVEADNLFKDPSDPKGGFYAVSAFATKYANYLKTCGNIIVDKETQIPTTEGMKLFNELSKDGVITISSPLNYKRVMDLMFISISQEITVENVKITDFELKNSSIDLNLFESLTYNGQKLNYKNLIKLFNMNLKYDEKNNGTSGIVISQEVLNRRLEDLVLTSIKNGPTFNSLDEITGDDLIKIKVNKNGQIVEKYLTTEIQADEGVKYLTYVSNNDVLEITNPKQSQEEKIWTVVANKEQPSKTDGVEILFTFYDEVSNQYFYQKAIVNIKNEPISVLQLNSELIKDMSVNETNNFGHMKYQYIDLSYDNIGKADSLISDFTMNQSYRTFKLFVAADTAVIDGVLKVKVKTVDGKDDSEPMTYKINYNGEEIDVYEIDYDRDKSGRVCIEALTTTIKYSVNPDTNNPSDKYENTSLKLYVSVVRTNVKGEPIDKDGNLVNEMVAEGEGEITKKYTYLYDIIKTADEVITFDIYSYLQDLQFYTKDKDGNLRNRTVGSASTDELKIKMIVDQTFDIYITNKILTTDGNFEGTTRDSLNKDTALFNFWFERLLVRDYEFSTNNSKAFKVKENISMVNGLIKIQVECISSSSATDLFVVKSSDQSLSGFEHLSSSRANMKGTYASISKKENGQYEIFARHTAADGTSYDIIENDQLSIKASLENKELIWLNFDKGQSTGKFEFGAEGVHSIDFGIDLDIDKDFESNRLTIIENLKENAKYFWHTNIEGYVNIINATSYSPKIEIIKGEPDLGKDIIIYCDIYLYGEAVEENPNKVRFSFRMNICQSKIIITGFSKNNNKWEQNISTETAQIVNGGSDFNILNKQTAEESSGTEVTREIITATMDNVDVISSLEFTIVTSGNISNSDKQAAYFLVNGIPTYTIKGVDRSPEGYSLPIYFKDTITDINVAVEIKSFNSSVPEYTYYIKVKANLIEQTNLPNEETNIRTTLGPENIVYTFDGPNKPLNEYYKIMNDGHEVKTIFKVVKNNFYGKIDKNNYFIPNRVASNKENEVVNVAIYYEVKLLDQSIEKYYYKTIKVYVIPYYNKISFSNSVFTVKAGIECDLFNDKDFKTGKELFNVETYNKEMTTIENLNNFIKFQIDTDENTTDDLIKVFGKEKYNILRNNNYYLTDGILQTNPALTKDTEIRIRVFFIEGDIQSKVEITDDINNQLHINVLDTIEYSTSNNTEQNAFEIKRGIEKKIQESDSSINLNYSNTVVEVYNKDKSVDENLVKIVGGEGGDVFGSVVKDIKCFILDNGKYLNDAKHQGIINDILDLIILRDTVNPEIINYVNINLKNSVNKIEYFKLIFVAENTTYEFYFKVTPDFTVVVSYPITDLNYYENVNNRTTINLEENYINKNKRIDLGYNGKLLNINNVSNDNLGNLTFDINKDMLVSSGILTKDEILNLGNSVKIVINNNNKDLFNYKLFSGSENVDGGDLNGSNITFSLKNQNNTKIEVKVTAFNGANVLYEFRLDNSLKKYRVDAVRGQSIYANNEFVLSNNYITRCKLDGEDFDEYSALIIKVIDFNGLKLYLNGVEVKEYDRIPYGSTLKFDDIAEKKYIVFNLYTKHSAYGDEIEEFRLEIKPNVIVTKNKKVIPAGVGVKLVNDESTSPFIITNGLNQEIESNIIFTIKNVIEENGYIKVDVNNEKAINKEIEITNNEGIIKYININKNITINVTISVKLTGCTFVVEESIELTPNIRVTFDYDTSAEGSIYKEIVSSPIKSIGENKYSNMSTIYLYKADSNDYPIVIKDFYGVNLTDKGPKVSLEVLYDEDKIVQSLDNNSHALNYYPTNKISDVKINVIVTWGNDITYIRVYNIRFMPNINDSKNIDIEYITKSGEETKKQDALIVVGGSTIAFNNFNTNRSDGVYNLEQNYDNITNAVSINLLKALNEKMYGFILFEKTENEFYKIDYGQDKTEAKITFKAVSKSTQVEIPYYLNLRYIENVSENIPYCGIFEDKLIDGKYVHEYYYKPTLKGVIKFSIEPVITSVTTNYVPGNPYEVRVVGTNKNSVNLYELLNVDLVSRASFVTSEDNKKVTIDKTLLADLFTIVDSSNNNFAIIDGENVVFNLNNNLVKEFIVKFKIEGYPKEVDASVTFLSNAELSCVEPVKTFIYDYQKYFVKDNLVYNYRNEEIGKVEGEEIYIGFEKISVVKSDLVVYNMSDGKTPVTNIYNSDAGTIDLTNLVKYQVTNRYVDVGSEEPKTRYYIDSNNKLIDKNGVELNAKYVVSLNEVKIDDGDPITISDEIIPLDKAGLTFVVQDGENDKFILQDNMLTLIPFYDTDVQRGKKEFKFTVQSNSNFETIIAFYVLPVETNWSIKYNDQDLFNVIKPVEDQNVIGKTTLKANYGTKTLTATDYMYKIINLANEQLEINPFTIDTTEAGAVLNVDYSKFHELTELDILVQATFNGGTVSHTFKVQVEPHFNYTNAYQFSKLTNPEADKNENILIKDNFIKNIIDEEFAKFNITCETNKYITIVDNVIIVNKDVYLFNDVNIVLHSTYTSTFNGVSVTFNDEMTLTLKQNTMIKNNLNKEMSLNTDFAGDKVDINTDKPLSIINLAFTETETICNNIKLGIETINVTTNLGTNYKIVTTLDNGIITVAKDVSKAKTNVNSDGLTYINLVIKLVVNKNATAKETTETENIYETEEISITIYVTEKEKA